LPVLSRGIAIGEYQLESGMITVRHPRGMKRTMQAAAAGEDRGRVARPFGSALTDPGRRLSRTRLFPEVTRIIPLAAPMGE
jgi:hypothetical protein